MRTAQNKKRSKAKSPEQIEKNQALIIQAHQDYLVVAQTYLDKARQTLATIKSLGISDVWGLVRKTEIEGFMAHADRQIEQTRRRVILGEDIPHGEKVFSIFEPHTEWISKGKAGVPVELGVKVCILEDQYQFILHHQVMQSQTDDQVTVQMATQAQKRFPNLNACSFDVSHQWLGSAWSGRMPRSWHRGIQTLCGLGRGGQKRSPHWCDPVATRY